MFAAPRGFHIILETLSVFYHSYGSDQLTEVYIVSHQIIYESIQLGFLHCLFIS